MMKARCIAFGLLIALGVAASGCNWLPDVHPDMEEDMTPSRSPTGWDDFCDPQKTTVKPENLQWWRMACRKDQ